MTELERIREAFKILSKNNEERCKFKDKSIEGKNDGMDIEIHVEKIDLYISVISHKYSYGGKQGLVEMMVEGEDPIGYLTASDFIDILLKKLKGE